MLERSKLLLIGKTWPEPKATAAGERIMQLLGWFKARGYKITFCSASTRGPYSCDLEAMGVSTREIALNDPSFDQFLKEEAFDIAVFDRFMTEEQFGWRVLAILPECLRILDTEDLHSLRSSREQAFLNKQQWNQTLWRADPVFYREMASIFRCDYSLIISSYELQQLQHTFPVLSERLLYLPFQFNMPQQRQPGFEARKDFIFVGNGKHRPNLDAIELLLETIWPELSSKVPQAELFIYGAYLPDRLKRAAVKKKRLQVIGWVENLAPVMQGARLQLVPLRFGAGVKGKILQGITMGLPSLTTAIGGEGIYDAATSRILSADTPETFVVTAEKLYRDQQLWGQALHLAGNAAKDHFQDPQVFGSQFIEKLHKPRPSYPGTESGLLASLLGKKAFDSSRYLSKWISEKKQKGPVERENPL
ncbi:glycosyltransferase [Robiginitalea sp. IMCC44478]|uniref:glycosyltransferase n=1 Tax=Robiginitalea sp. IMCC44478 TaxID=3459122 RepID=UPI004042670A